jgi:ComF family protein
LPRVTTVRLRSAWESVLDLVYPPRCGGCDRRGVWFCDACRASIVPARDDARGVNGIDRVLSAGEFSGHLRRAIHNLKYEGDTPLARPLARMLYEFILDDRSLEFHDGVAHILPVPLHRTRYRRRGYNQSNLLARNLALMLGLPLTEGLVRSRHTRPQVGLNPAERRQNVEGAFEWLGGEAPSIILLVDDVCTTGATLSACAACLREKGTGIVLAATVARAVDHTSDSRL